MAVGLLLDARCETCGYTEHNLALGANREFMLEEPEGWLSVITACPSCRTLIDVALSREEVRASDGAPDLTCPDCGTPVPRPNEIYPDLTLTKIARREQTVIEEQRCPQCGEQTLTVWIVGTFE